MDLFIDGRSRSLASRNLQFSIFNLQFSIALALLAYSAASAAPSAPPSDPVVRKAPTWHLPQVADVKAQAADWVRKNCKDTAAQAKALAIVAGIAEKADGTELLDRLGEAFAAADPGVAQLVDPARARGPARCCPASPG